MTTTTVIEALGMLLFVAAVAYIVKGFNPYMDQTDVYEYTSLNLNEDDE